MVYTFKMIAVLRKFDYSGKWLGIGAWLLVLLLCVGMAESQLSKQQCNNLLVKVDYDSGVRFISKSDIEKILTDNGNHPIHGNRQKNIQLKLLEKRIRENKLIKDCQVYHDLDGNLVVDVEQEKPLARWINTSQNGEWRTSNGFYINAEGDFIPLSDRYSARVLLVSGSFFQNTKNLGSSKGKSVLEMISYLNENPFWRAQIIQMQVSKAGDVELFTALGDQRIEFGKSDNFDVKLSKLRVFYKKVMASDWSRYSKVSVKFQDQIVCE